MQLPKLPTLGDDSKSELPSGDTKMSTQRGTLAHWVISTLAIGFSGLLFTVNSNYRTQIEKCELENATYRQILIPQLNQIEKVLEEAEVKAVNIVNKIESKDSLTIKKQTNENK